MSVIAQQPQTLNLASELNYSFVILRAPSVTYFAQDVSIPDVGCNPAKVPSPSMTIPLVGDHMFFDPLMLSFKVDEQLQNYLEIFNWIEAIANPNNTGTQYAQLEKNQNYSGYGIYSDLQLFTMDSQKQVQYVITFEKCFPTRLTGPKYNTTDSTIKYMSSSVEFHYTKFRFALP